MDGRRRLRLPVLRKLDQILIGVTNIDRSDGAEGARALNWAEFDRNSARFYSVDRFVKGHIKDKTKVGRPWSRRFRMGGDFRSGQVQIDLLPAKTEGLPPGTKLDPLHAENADVEGAGALQVLHGKHEVVKAVDHGISLAAAGIPGRICGTILSMSTALDKAVRDHLLITLRGGQAFDRFYDIVREVPPDCRYALPMGRGRSAWQIIEHMRLTLEDLAEFTDNSAGNYTEKVWPDDYWPEKAEPEDHAAWDRSVHDFLEARRKMEELVQDPNRDLTEPFAWGKGQTLLHEALLAIEHTAYHLGELVELTALFAE